MALTKCPECGYGIKAHFDRINAEKQWAEQKRRIEAAERKKQEERIKNIKRPEKPGFSRFMIVYFKKYDAYNLAESDFEEYKKKVIRDEDELARLARENMPKVIMVKCPNCGATDTGKITTMKRMTSVAMVGIASDKIGKQYECNICKYKW